LPTLTTASIRKGILAAIKIKKPKDVAGTPKEDAKKAQSKSTTAVESKEPIKPLRSCSKALLIVAAEYIEAAAAGRAKSLD